MTTSAQTVQLNSKRLLHLLSQLRPLLPRQRSPVPQRTAPAAARVTELVDIIRPELDAARRRGAFIDVWAVAGIGRKEVRTAAVLAWLLDPQGSHGCGAAFLHAVWNAAGGSNRPEIDLSQPCTVRTEVTPLGNTSDRVDIAIEGQDFLIYVEVKIDASDQQNQIERYDLAAARKAALFGKTQAAVVYLSERKPPKGAMPLRWRQVAAAIELAARAQESDAFGALLARQFATHVANLH